MAAIPAGRHHLEHVIEGHDLISPSDHTLDADSLKDESSSLKASIHSTIHGHDYHEGRRFHGHKKGSYLLPNDAEECDRLNMHHEVYKHHLKGALYLAPLGSDIKRVLDFGCGTGIWDIELANQNPEFKVVGIDLSPMWHGTLPANCDLSVQDAEADWGFKPEEVFDFIHGRAMGASIADWPGLYKDAMKNMKPGGWVEVQEYDAWIYSDTDPKLEQAPYIKQLQELCEEASKKHGKHFNCSEFQKQWMTEAGFTNVQEHVFKTPIGSWAKDPELKEVGKKERKNLIACVESFALAPLTRVMGWSAADAHSLIAKIRNEFRDPNLRLTSVYRYVYGQKPSQ